MTRTTFQLVTPYGGRLIDLIVPDEEAVELSEYAKSLPSATLTPRLMCDLELLATGAFSPLGRFMDSADYARVLDQMSLADGSVFPIPVTLPTNNVSGIEIGSEIALRDTRNDIVAVMTVEEIFETDPEEYVAKVLRTRDAAHPLVAEARSWGRYNLAGRPRVIALPRHYDFPELRLTPAEVRFRLAELGNAKVVAFQTRNPLHRAHEELTRRAMDETGGTLLLHPVVGLTKPGDIDHYCRVRSYQVLVENYYPKDRVLLALLPLAMRFAGPREALWHALIRRNYGASHFIVGRDHASPGVDSTGKPFYEPYAAQSLVESFADEIGVTVVPFREFVYQPATASYEESGDDANARKISGTQVREEYLNAGQPLPAWFTRPEVAAILQEEYPPRTKQGVCIWLTGLSAAGKSTIAEILTVMLSRYGRRSTLLDGDIVRARLSAGLGFDREGRDENIRRIGFVASEIVRHGGIAVCAAISPYGETRAEVRRMFDAGSFIEVFVDTPLEECERRDPKGMYAKARAGEITNFTGISDIYEPPDAPEIRLTTVDSRPEDDAREIVDYLVAKGFLSEANV